MIQFDEKVQQVLIHYQKRMAVENSRMQSLSMEDGFKLRNEFLLPVGEDTATFLHTLIKSAKAKTILEIGTSYGYSTLWLADAARLNGAKLITLESDKIKADFAKQKINDAGLAAYVDFRVGDAMESIRTSTDMFDLVLIDLWKELYVPCLNLLFPKLNKGAWIIADNMIYPAHDIKETTAYRNCIRATNAFDTVLMPIGSGIEVSYYKL
jgi:predicted O-methyltransferase YrrM